MSIETINPVKRTCARKEYIDGTKWFILEYWNNEGDREMFTPEEKQLIEKAIADGWKIKKGEIHEAGVFKCERNIYTFRNKIGLSEICDKYELWPEI